MREDNAPHGWPQMPELLNVEPGINIPSPDMQPRAGEPVERNGDGALEDDRRSGPRYRTVMRAARLASGIHKIETLGLVRNISEGGMLVHSHAEFATGDSVMISVLDGEGIEGTIVWQDEGAVGIKFNNWISVETVLNRTPQANGARHPRPPRLALDKAIMVRVDAYLADATIRDISQRGAKIQFNSFLPIDCRVQISRGNLRPISGSVKWQAGNIVGLEFHRTLGLDELAEWTSAD